MSVSDIFAYMLFAHVAFSAVLFYFDPVEYRDSPEVIPVEEDRVA